VHFSSSSSSLLLKMGIRRAQIQKKAREQQAAILRRHLGRIVHRRENSEADCAEAGVLEYSIRRNRILKKEEIFDSNSNWQIGNRFARIVVVQNSFMNNSKARSNIRE
jgi:hypothetical protein